MRKNILAFIILFITCMATVKVQAMTQVDDDEFEVVAQTNKYYKTVTILNNSEVMAVAELGELSSITTEISEEEYMNAPDDNGITPYASVTTSYKKLTSTISKSYNYYKYEADLTWKTMPATRSYDIIAVGYFGSVKQASTVHFKQSYCTVDDYCNTTTSFYEHTDSNGSAAIFNLPTGSLKSLSQNMYVLVEKTVPSSTVVEQNCVADYAHATKTVTSTMARDIWVDTGGIVLDSGYSYYDSMPEAIASWTGTW